MSVPNTFAARTGSIPLADLDENFTSLDTNKLDKTGSATLSGNLTITGDLTVNGTQNIINTTDLAVEDNMIYLNSESTVANPDLGIAGNYNDGTYQHAGLFRDASDGYWKFYDSYTPEPDASAFIDTTHTSYSSAPLQVSTVKLNNWTITESGGVLYFATGGTNKMKLDASGNLTVSGDVTAFGTV